MWNEKLQQHADKMRKKFARMVELLHIVEKKDVAGTEYVSLRITQEQRQKGLDKSIAVSKAKGDVHRNTVVDIDPNNSQVGKTIRDPSKRTAYPPCPHCNGSRPEGTIRAGIAAGIQRYRCQQCRKTFSGPTVRIRLEPQDYKMICYHCGSHKTKRIGKGVSDSRSGRMGLCLGCGKKFVQGGLKDLQKYHLLLEKRIIDLKLPDEVEAEVLQIAVMDVLAGKGYCWTVELKTKEAWRNCRGEYKQKGSDHPAFKEQQGQAKYENNYY